MYDSYHEVKIVKRNNKMNKNHTRVIATIVGNICEVVIYLPTGGGFQLLKLVI